MQSVSASAGPRRVRHVLLRDKAPKLGRQHPGRMKRDPARRGCRRGGDAGGGEARSGPAQAAPQLAAALRKRCDDAQHGLVVAPLEDVLLPEKGGELAAQRLRRGVVELALEALAE